MYYNGEWKPIDMKKRVIKNKRMPKAYENIQFLKGPFGREIRILSEYAEPRARFIREKIEDTIVFFGSARIIPPDEAMKNYRRLEVKLMQLKKPSKKLLSEFEEAKIKLEMSNYYLNSFKLAKLLTQWSNSLNHNRRFVVCSGGGPGIMEAANKGALNAGGKSIGLNISLPHEQYPNSYINEELNFEFHYFFMRKFWFVYLAKAMVIFPGGFGTMDELFEVLTLLQSQKIQKHLIVVLYGEDYWRKIINFPEMIRLGVISKEDLKLFKFCNTPEETFEYLKKQLSKYFLK